MRTPQEVIQIIKRLREQQGLSLEELGRRVGAAKSTLSRYENGQREFPINDIQQYADVLNISVSTLLGIEHADEIDTIAAHHDGEDWTDEELAEIENFKRFIKMKRKDSQ